MNKEELEKIKQKALQEHIPIIMDETLEVIEKYLKENPPKKILEIGAAVGYSAMCFSEYLNDNGLADARLEMPRAHAVARSQINIRALHSIKMQMRQNDWIIQSGRDDRQRMLWQLTPKGQKLLESNLLDNNRVFQFNSSY